MRLFKTQAYGNDFLLIDAAEARVFADWATLARRVCHRHRGLGADGLIVVTPTERGAATTIFNQDGSQPEVSGNGIRCVGAWLAQSRGLAPGEALSIETAAGIKRLVLLDREAADKATRYRFRAEMGAPSSVQQETLDVAGQHVNVVTLSMGNPQCVVLGPATESRLKTFGLALATHPRFPEGTNVEFADVESAERVRILIWERGVGPTEASGTGACAAAVAAASFGGAARSVDVTSPGGTQRVEWTESGVWLTGWAEVVATMDWNV